MNDETFYFIEQKESGGIHVIGNHVIIYPDMKSISFQTIEDVIDADGSAQEDLEGHLCLEKGGLRTIFNSIKERSPKEFFDREWLKDNGI